MIVQKPKKSNKKNKKNNKKHHNKTNQPQQQQKKQVISSAKGATQALEECLKQSKQQVELIQSKFNQYFKGLLKH